MNATPILSSAPIAADPAQANGVNSAESPQSSGGGHDFAAVLSDAGPRSGRKSAPAKAHGDTPSGGQLPGPGNFPPPPANAIAAPVTPSASSPGLNSTAAAGPAAVLGATPAQAAATVAAGAAITAAGTANSAAPPAATAATATMVAGDAAAAKNAAAFGIEASAGAQIPPAAPHAGDDVSDSAGAAAPAAAAASGPAAALAQAPGLPAAAEAGASGGSKASVMDSAVTVGTAAPPVQDSSKGHARESAGSALTAKVRSGATAAAIGKPSAAATAAGTSAASRLGGSAGTSASAGAGTDPTTASVDAGPPAGDANTQTAAAAAISAAANGAVAAAANAADSAVPPAGGSPTQAVGSAAPAAGGPAGSAARPMAAVTAAAATAAAAKPAASPAAVAALAEAGASDKHAGSDSPASTTPDGAAGLAQLSVNSLSPTDAPGAPTLKVAAGVDTPEFGQGLADRVSYMIGNNLNGAKLQVNPPQLGPIEVRIAVQGDHAQVWMTSHSAVTRDALESSSPKLREMLGAQGFGQVSVDISQRSFQERPSQAQSYDWTPPAVRDTSAAIGAAAAPSARAARGALDAYA